MHYWMQTGSSRDNLIVVSHNEIIAATVSQRELVALMPELDRGLASYAIGPNAKRVPILSVYMATLDPFRLRLKFTHQKDDGTTTDTQVECADQATRDAVFAEARNEMERNGFVWQTEPSTPWRLAAPYLFAGVVCFGFAILLFDLAQGMHDGSYEPSGKGMILVAFLIPLINIVGPIAVLADLPIENEIEVLELVGGDDIVAAARALAPRATADADQRALQRLPTRWHGFHLVPAPTGRGLAVE